MHRFFAADAAERETILLDENESKHARSVLRVRDGETAELLDGQGRRFGAQIDGTENGRVRVRRLTELPGNEPEVRVTLYPGLPKLDKLDFVVQKAVELGAYEVVPMATHRAVVKLDQKKEESKRKRWNAIAESAAKQSKRTVIPEVTKVFSFREAVIYAVETYDVCLIPYECAEGMEQTRAILAKVQPGTSVAILIGPEGGFEESEIAYAQEKGVHPITLGHRILRTETAGLAVLSALMLQLDLD